MNTIFCILSIICYLIIGMFICKKYIDMTNEISRIGRGSRKQRNNTKRLLKRLSIMLFYPIYTIIIMIGLLIELLTEDEPFK